MKEDDLIALSRRELYELVWKAPMSRLGVWLGVPGIDWVVSQAKIPRPPLGHWMKVEHGKKTRQKPLPDPDRAEETACRISRGLYEKIQDEIARGGNFQVDEEPDPDWLVFEKDPLHKITVPDELTNPHPLVLRTQKALVTARPKEDGRIRPRWSGVLCVIVTPENLDRALRIMDALVKAIELRGIKLKLADKAGDPIQICVDGEWIHFGLEEVCRQEELPPEPQSDYALRWGLRGVKNYRTVPTGMLAIRLHESHNYWRKKWEDGKTQRVEGCLNKFFIELHKLAASKKKTHETWLQAQREREEARKRHETVLRMQQEEKARIDRLEKESALWQKSEMIRGYIEAFRRKAELSGDPLAPGTESGDWIEWAVSYANRVDPLVQSPPSILDEKTNPYFY